MTGKADKQPDNRRMAMERGSEVSEPINISEARALFEKTTQGEWEAVTSDSGYSDIIALLKSGATTDVVTSHNCESSLYEENMEWIAKSHNEYPAMLDELERLRFSREEKV